MLRVVRLRSENIDGSKVCGLGSQLQLIVESIANRLGDVDWYAADIDVLNAKVLQSSTATQRVGRTGALLELLQRGYQFLRGVFIAVDSQIQRPRLRQLVDTEDPSDTDLGNSLLEIRAFDSTYFEVVTRDFCVVTDLVEAFGRHGEVEVLTISENTLLDDEFTR